MYIFDVLLAMSISMSGSTLKRGLPSPTPAASMPSIFILLSTFENVCSYLQIYLTIENIHGTPTLLTAYMPPFFVSLKFGKKSSFPEYSCPPNHCSALTLKPAPKKSLKLFRNPPICQTLWYGTTLITISIYQSI